METRRIDDLPVLFCSLIAFSAMIEDVIDRRCRLARIGTLTIVWSGAEEREDLGCRQACESAGTDVSVEERVAGLEEDPLGAVALKSGGEEFGGRAEP